MSCDTFANVGFDSKMFVNEPTTDFLCLICTKVLNTPRQCINGHCFCKQCIVDATEQCPECPVCKVNLTQDTLGKSVFLESLISDMVALCPSLETTSLDPMENSHCSWTGKMRDRQIHSEECSHCFQFAHCDHCEFSFNTKDLNEHEKSCEFRPVYCTNECGLIMAYNEMKCHMEHDCQLQLVDCPLSTLSLCKDCPEELSRKDLKEHLAGTKSLPQSVLILVNVVIAQHTRMATMESKLTATMTDLLTETRSDGASLREQVEKMAGQLEVLGSCSTTRSVLPTVAPLPQGVDEIRTDSSSLPSLLGSAVTTYPLPSSSSSHVEQATQSLAAVGCVQRSKMKSQTRVTSTMAERMNAKKQAARELASDY